MLIKGDFSPLTFPLVWACEHKIIIGNIGDKKGKKIVRHTHEKSNKKNVNTTVTRKNF